MQPSAADDNLRAGRRLVGHDLALVGAVDAVHLDLQGAGGLVERGAEVLDLALELGDAILEAQDVLDALQRRTDLTTELTTEGAV